ncbi:TetR/AcrR family transcriptional regulator [Lentzea sp. NPDC051838]|uniref:TetR/AcrR family transcriptional regulator n=1 Tax=Lentzea sp. NPDC051838 TaxID=3154849 RepID=UPI003446E0EF
MARQALTRDRVLAAAIRVADQGGVSAISMRKVAQELDVEAMSLYHHVPNKEALLDGVVDAVFTLIDLPPDAPDWRDALRARSSSARDVLSQHSWALGLLDSRRNPGSPTLTHHNAVLGVLRQAGFSVALAVHAVSLLDSYVYGFVIQEASLPSDDVEQVAGEIVEQADELPHLKEVAAHTARSGYSPADDFAFGLGLILDALEARRSVACARGDH